SPDCPPVKNATGRCERTGRTLTGNEFQDTLAAERVVAILRCGSAAQALDTAKALLTEGIRIVEVSLNTPGAIEAIAELSRHYGTAPGTLIGAGTVLDAKSVEEVADAGARFFVSPVFDESAVAVANDLGLAAVPGCLTPTEMLRAHQAGAAAIKVFPATEWTPEGLRNVARALPFLRLIPTGRAGHRFGPREGRQRHAAARSRRPLPCEGPAMTAAEMLTKPLAHHGEGPVWVARDTSLYWVDMLAGDVLQLDGEGQVSRHHVGSVAAALRPRASGGLVVAVERGFALVEHDWTMRELPEAFADVSVRMNDGGCDPQGRFYCGTMAYDAAPGAGTLFRLDPDESVHVVLDGVTVSNGLAWSPDGATVYYVDSATQRIDAFDFDAGSVAFQHRRTVVQIDPDLGSPDGLTVDGEGGLWVALWDGAAVHRYSPDGRLAEVIELPTPRVSACTFGGERLDQLFITT